MGKTLLERLENPRIKDMTDGIDADPVLECVGTGEPMTQALRPTRPGGLVGFVGVPHGGEPPGRGTSAPTSNCAAVRHPCAASWN